MSLKDLEPGTYTGTVEAWGLTPVEKLGKDKAFVTFRLETGDVITWDDFLVTKEGKPNKKTLTALLDCGLKDIDSFPKADSLERGKVMNLTVVQDDEYLRVEWVNDPARSGNKFEAIDPKVAVKKVKGMNLGAAFNTLKRDLGVGPKNHAPGVTPGGIDTEDSIPF